MLAKVNDIKVKGLFSLNKYIARLYHNQIMSKTFLLILKPVCTPPFLLGGAGAWREDGEGGEGWGVNLLPNFQKGGKGGCLRGL